jgi:hypothetical protein
MKPDGTSKGRRKGLKNACKMPEFDEVRFPMIGKNAEYFSNGWKNAVQVFQ